MTAINMCSNFGGKWDSLPLNKLYMFGTESQEEAELLSNVNFYCSIYLLMIYPIEFFQITLN